MKAGGETAWNTAVGLVNDFSNGTPRFRNTNVERTVWERVVDTATRYNEPGAFTALNGYEWTTSTGGSNLHRVVVFQDGSDRVKQVLPFSAFDSTDPEDLWAFMAGYEAKTGGRALAIPHNPNLSNGVMFAETVNGRRMTKRIPSFLRMMSLRTLRPGTSPTSSAPPRKTGCCSTSTPVVRSM
jgi:hypothetical protein